MIVNLFDITPVRDDVELGLPYNYWNATNMTQWLADVVQVAEAVEAQTGEPMTMRLKPKRAYTDQHDPGYIARLRQEVDRGRIVLVDYQTSLYDLVESAAWTLVVPYSSPALVAASRCAPAVYYDATQTLVPTYEPSRWIRVASGRDQLHQAWLRAMDEAP